jgi:predicted nucleic acid-binding protein
MQNQPLSYPNVVKLLARSRAYDPNLSPADIEGIEIALARSAILITQDDLQRVEAISAGVKMVADTLEVLEVFKRLGVIAQVRPVLEQMEQNGERYSKSERNKLLRRVNEPLIL